MQLGLAHRTLEAEQEPVIEHCRVVDAVVDRMTKEDRVRVLFSLFNAVTPIDVAVDNLRLTTTTTPA